jgi:hypothetical protein
MHLDTPSMFHCAFGSVALLAGGMPDSTCAPPTLDDLVGWDGTGTGRSFIRCFLGKAAGNFCYVLIRQGGGWVDTGNNFSDFFLGSSDQVTPHNSASARNATCLSVPAEGSSWGRLKAIYR